MQPTLGVITRYTWERSFTQQADLERGGGQSITDDARESTVVGHSLDASLYAGLELWLRPELSVAAGLHGQVAAFGVHDRVSPEETDVDFTRERSVRLGLTPGGAVSLRLWF